MTDGNGNAMGNDTTWIVTIFLVIGAIVLGLLALYLAFLVLVAGFMGAAWMFAYAAAQGFLGVVAYVAAWVFLFPFMAIASLGLGAVLLWSFYWEERASRGARIEPKVPFHKRLVAWLKNENVHAPTPPSDPEERYKWANRLPPYD
ncbi:hypothetical protein FLO80_19895 [Aquicoccus porphyridii]|uniref:Uncharacterized protein n=1 Tax=Aquicoccus porphyridii TaxID=1852029 RepID=A0A5A9YY84_9RHOB|nr:hypothetical protein [Aquicoccus porphyridii]KAA0909830.1 hypothetical protein FLO80_19895 [Aquicoccus porphyridii]RAI51793.1 hypothetical protein DOO74_21285 [Rhodobacteraceae bacterium AsT-22]